ncbi:MAG: hypothetical protein EOO77_40780 [Oxalobacteraceae bacterium]|nr:MAG: hypothetical protein EOO77_40780 [Oxalobacteraceae bacterium]
MATYNFTIRATDNAGAYSDRAFNLTVNNTIYDRFIAVGNTGLIRSPDSVTWTYESGLTGTAVIYGGGRWLVYNASSSNLTMRTSADGTSWSTYTPTFSGAGATINVMWAIKYRNGAWVGIFGSTSNSTLWEYSSPDGAAWTQVTSLGAYGAMTDFDYDAAGTLLIYNNATGLFVSKHSK